MVYLSTKKGVILVCLKNDQNREKQDRLTTPHIQSPLSKTDNQPNHKLSFITQDTKPGSSLLLPSPSDPLMEKISRLERAVNKLSGDKYDVADLSNLSLYPKVRLPYGFK